MIIPVNLAGSSYDIVVEKDVIKKCEEYFDLDRKVLIVTDDGVPSSYAQQVAKKSRYPVIKTLKQGEGSKSVVCFENLLTQMLLEGFTRKDVVVAVGGGVVGDIAGFVASTYMRGIDFYNVPTTLLSQIDSSIGGKTAINLNGIKNIVGAFYQPKKVLIDSNLLRTLDNRLVSAGLAESVKMALTSNGELFNFFENQESFDDLDKIIIESIKIKKEIVEADEKEENLRKILNFGHTLGHGIESQENIHGLYHGECVALGMIPMCGSQTKNRLIQVLRKLNLPTSIKLNKERVLEAVKHDKKGESDKITIVKVNEPGSFVMQETTFDNISKKFDEILR